MAIFTLLITLLPGLYNYLSGRRLLRRLEEPVFPELYFARVQRGGQVTALCLVLALILDSRWPLITVFLAFFSAGVGNYWFRKAVFHETWSLFRSLSHGTRLYLVILRTWALLAFLPLAVLAAHEFQPAAAVPVAAGMAFLLLASYIWSPQVFRLLMAPVPLQHPHLEARFQEILAQVDCRSPKLMRAGPKGGSWVQAFAIPSFFQPLVVLSNDLLEALGPREVTAVFAHEVSHLEEFRPRRLLRGVLELLVQAGIALVVLFWFGLSSPWAEVLSWLWPLGCVFLLQRQFSGNQTREHESDIRALELCRDPQALMDALTKITVLGSMPRRWTTHDESQFSHPSLAQRLRAIREAAIEKGLMEAPMTSTEVSLPMAPTLEGEIVVCSGSSALVLSTERLHWLSDIPSNILGHETQHHANTLLRAAGKSRAIPYGELTDLRLLPSLGEGLQLVAADNQGHTLKLPLKAAEAAVVQERLLRIEPLLGSVAPAKNTPSRPSGWLRFDAFILLLNSLAATSGSLFLLSLLVMIRPAVAPLAAAGTLALGLALKTVLAPEVSLFFSEAALLGLAASLAFFGFMLLFGAWQRYRLRQADPAWTWYLPAAWLILVSAFSLVPGLLSLAQPFPALMFHRWAMDNPGLIVLLPTLAAVLLTLRRPWAPWVAAFLGTFTLLVVFAGTHGFRAMTSNDPLNQPIPKVALETWPFEQVRRLKVRGYVQDLVLSPEGSRLAIQSWDVSRTRDAEQPTYLVELGNGHRLRIEAVQAAFLDEEHFAVVRMLDDFSLRLSLVPLVPSTEETFEIALPELEGYELLLGPGGTWAVSGLHMPDTGETERKFFRGTFEAEDFEVHSFPYDGENIPTEGVINADNSLLTNTVNYEFGESFLRSLLHSLMDFEGTTTLALRGKNGPRILLETPYYFTCMHPLLDQRAFLCTVDNDDRTELWNFDPTDDLFKPVVSIPGEYMDPRLKEDGRLLLTGLDGPTVLVDLETLRATEIGPQLDLPTWRERLDETVDLPETGLTGALLGETFEMHHFSATDVASGYLAVAMTGVEETGDVFVYRRVQ